MEEIIRLIMRDPATLSESEKRMVKSIRETADAPDASTWMQKVIPLEDIEDYLSGSYFPQAGGFVSKREDVGHLKTPMALYSTMRLDYTDTKFIHPKHDSVGILVFKTEDTDLLKIPYNPEMHGDVNAAYPFAGNGFTKAVNGQIIPEYKSLERMNLEQAEIYLINSQGECHLIATYDPASGKFISQTEQRH